ncbi:hypothetical protein TNCV_1544321 [Trichonephila clavipes]|nr:hypothetical protein TNCV_1544321 [Trichonephila clavipes]
MEGMVSVPLRYHTFRKKKRFIALISFLMQIYGEAALLNGLLHSNYYEKRRVKPCIEVLLTTSHSALAASGYSFGQCFSNFQCWPPNIQ